MANCSNCGAALLPDSVICTYCKTRNDVDLREIHRYTREYSEAERICPRCEIPLQTIDLKIEDRFLIESCRHCFGIFFDPGEMEALLDRSVSNVYRINTARIDEIIGSRPREEYPVTYIKCPVCRRLMNRFNIGTRSGVIGDRCKEHGVWLDGGELRQLMEWTKAGGRTYTLQSQLEAERIAWQEEKKTLNRLEVGSRPAPSDESFTIDGSGLEDLLAKAFRLIAHFVRGI